MKFIKDKEMKIEIKTHEQLCEVIHFYQEWQCCNGYSNIEIVQIGPDC